MADAIGIIGLTIAVLDQLIKLAERTADLAADIRTFGEVPIRHKPLLNPHTGLS
jgi:hypothetical protein